MIKFIAWLRAIFPYAACYYWFRARWVMGEGKKIGWFIGLIPMILLVELIGVMGCLAMIGDADARTIFIGYVTSPMVQ